MKSLRIYLIVFVVLAALAIFFFLSRRSGSYAPSKQEFAVLDTAGIETIQIISETAKADISNRGGKWFVNGKPAREDAVRGLYVLVSRLEVVAPVSRSLEENIRLGLEKQSTRVNILMEDGKEKGYRVYYDQPSDATFMMLDGTDVVFRMHVRGYRQTNLAVLFPSDPRFWRDNVIFQALPGEVKAVLLQNKVENEKSFYLMRNEKGDFDIAGGIIPDSWVPATGENVSQYLGYFYDVRFESFLDPESDTLMHSEEPDFILQLELVDGRRTSAWFFPTVPMDYDRLYVWLEQGEEWVVVKYVEIDPLLKEFEYFRAPKK